MTSHLKGVKYSTLIDEMRKALCEYKNEHPSSSQKVLQQRVQQTFDLSVSQSTISNILKEKVNMTGEMIQSKAKEFLQKMYERFKARHGIKSYKRFDALPQIRVKLEIFYWKDIYNMDETDLFYCLQSDHSLAIKQLEGQKKDKKRLTVVEDIPLEQEIGDVEGILKLKEVIFYLHYRNAMDVESILNYPSKNESLMESPTDEEIIQGVMDVSADDEQDPSGSSLLPHVSPKEAFLVVDTLKNYLIQHDKNIPYLIYAFLKVKDEIEFDSHTKKKQLTIDEYFNKE
ncbi:hypothetical protein ES319_A03G149400v1 [Gossypium barbadense]|uniref:Uncharacterized protein n=1 Tax=Gossypium barbadense TaxID=3634 RepID=A0A5J5WF43_GOSBA|nr:hypothetical protein ES319_A03G149400v1 [Gossypium barbadense]